MIFQTAAVKTKHDDFIKWKHFPRYWPFVRGIHRSQSQQRGALIFSLICAWINRWVNNREAVDLRPHRAHYDVIVMKHHQLQGRTIQLVSATRTYVSNLPKAQCLSILKFVAPNTQTKAKQKTLKMAKNLNHYTCISKTVIWKYNSSGPLHKYPCIISWENTTIILPYFLELL